MCKPGYHNVEDRQNLREGGCCLDEYMTEWVHNIPQSNQGQLVFEYQRWNKKYEPYEFNGVGYPKSVGKSQFDQMFSSLEGQVEEFPYIKNPPRHIYIIVTSAVLYSAALSGMGTLFAMKKWVLGALCALIFILGVVFRICYENSVKRDLDRRLNKRVKEIKSFLSQQNASVFSSRGVTLTCGPYSAWIVAKVAGGNMAQPAHGGNNAAKMVRVN